ncbi:hypothetical protein A5637_13220 [Mycolicibacterium fortuitum]|uniref:hypothetical protein n=1 Tax=Mycolicibacterium fortuitum TaxID=1766 RepID=UPI0007ED6767|nr:hypothetical protein [Mycolicibacterium fortuitum]OBK04036.1 hypothetical protein A5637_13220 [Mycolicibacterium fortuitum]
MNSVGECILRLERNSRTGADELHIDHADPHVLVALEIIDQAIHEPNDMLWMDFTNQQICFDDHQHDFCACFTLRSILHIKGVNREVLYRITPHPDRTDVYEGRWPD